MDYKEYTNDVKRMENIFNKLEIALQQIQLLKINVEEIGKLDTNLKRTIIDVEKLNINYVQNIKDVKESADNCVAFINRLENIKNDLFYGTTNVIKDTLQPLENQFIKENSTFIQKIALENQEIHRKLAKQTEEMYKNTLFETTNTYKKGLKETETTMQDLLKTHLAIRESVEIILKKQKDIELQVLESTKLYTKTLKLLNYYEGQKFKKYDIFNSISRIIFFVLIALILYNLGNAYYLWFFDKKTVEIKKALEQMHLFIEITKYVGILYGIVSLFNLGKLIYYKITSVLIKSE